MKKEYAYRQVEKDIQSGAVKNVVLLHGKEQYLVKWAINMLVNQFINQSFKAIDFSTLDPDSVTIDSLIEHCETLSLASARRMVLLPGFSPLKGSGARNFPEESVKALAAYIQAVPDTCLLVLTAESVDKRKKLYKEIAAWGQSYEFGALDEATLCAFIEKRFKLAEKKISPSVIGELIACTGYFHKETAYTLYNLENDIKKIAAYSDGNTIALSDVLAVVSGDLEMNVFGMIDAISGDRKGEAYRLLGNLLGSGSSVFMILSLLASQFEIILEVKELKAEGKTAASMQRLLNVHEFRIKKALAFEKGYGLQRLRNILRKIYRVEKDIKSGQREAALALEVLIAEM